MTQPVGKIWISHKRVRKLLDYNPETGWLTWKVVPKHRSGVIKVGDRAGYPQKKGRAITIDNQWYSEHRFIWYWMTGKSAPVEIDHKDRDFFNNKWDNLRLATGLQNCGNQVLLRRNKTGYRGVGFAAASTRGHYFAQIHINGKQRVLGYFTTAVEAHEAYKTKAKELRGEFYREPSKPRVSICY